MEFWIKLSCIIIFIAGVAVTVILKNRGERIFDFLFAIWTYFIGFSALVESVEGGHLLVLKVIFWIIAILILCLALAAVIFLILSFVYEKKEDKKKEIKSINCFYLLLIIAGILNIILQILRIFIK